MSRVRHRMGCIQLVCLLILEAAPAEAQSPVRQILVLQSFDRGNMVLDYFTGGLRVELDERAGGPVNVVQVVVGPTGFIGAPERVVVDFIRSAFAARAKPDLIIAVAGPASVFASKYRQQIFPDTPLLFAAVDERYLASTPLGENDTAVAVVMDFAGTVSEILQLLPETRQVFMVVGSGAIGEFWRSELEDRFQQFRDRVTFVWSDDLSFPEILRRSANLPDGSAILYITFGTDAAGAAYADERVLSDLHAAANAPMFGALSVHLGTGVVGGRLLSIDDMIDLTADAAIGILMGAAAPRRIAAAIVKPADIRLARTAAVGHPREPVALGQRGALSRSEPVERIPGHSPGCRRRTRDSGVPDYRAAVGASRTAAGRARQPQKLGARR